MTQNHEPDKNNATVFAKTANVSADSVVLSSDEVGQANSKTIADGVASGLNRSKTSLNDKRLVVIAAFVVLFCVLTTAWQNNQTRGVKDQNRTIQEQNRTIQEQTKKVQDAQHAAQIVCQQTDAANVKFNKVVDQLITNATNSTGITPEQKAQAIATYSDLHLPIIDCSKLATG